MMSEVLNGAKPFEQENSSQEVEPLRIKDIKTVGHIHTNLSECAVFELRDLLEYARDHIGCESIIICDHSETPRKAVFNNPQAEEKLLEQKNQIDKLNEQNLGPNIFTGVEANILASGDLDLSDETLKQLDFVIASRHELLKNQTPEDIEKALISACNNPQVDCLGHPTSDMSPDIMEKVNWERIFEVATTTSTVIEINIKAPMPPHILQKAISQNINFFVGSDFHDFEQYLKQKPLQPDQEEKSLAEKRANFETRIKNLEPQERDILWSIGEFSSSLTSDQVAVLKKFNQDPTPEEEKNINYLKQGKTLTPDEVERFGLHLRGQLSSEEREVLNRAYLKENLGWKAWKKVGKGLGPRNKRKGLTKERVINCWPQEKLHSWLTTHKLNLERFI